MCIKNKYELTMLEAINVALIVNIFLELAKKDFFVFSLLKNRVETLRRVQNKLDIKFGADMYAVIYRNIEQK